MERKRVAVGAAASAPAGDSGEAEVVVGRGVAADSVEESQARAASAFGGSVVAVVAPSNGAPLIRARP